MATRGSQPSVHRGFERPPRADLRKMMAAQPLPSLPPRLIDPSSMAGNASTIQARAVLDELNNALDRRDVNALESCFYAPQAYWKDELALTWHLRTLRDPGTIAAGLLETLRLRGIDSSTNSGIGIDGAAAFVPATPVLQFIDCPIIFKTKSPGALCRGKVVLLPVAQDSNGYEVAWKIWVLSTRLESLDIHPENVGLLQYPRKPLDNYQSEDFETDVLIIGAGNSGVALSAQLKALGVQSIIIDRNARPGDNWALRYDCMKFHIPTSFCHLPHMRYDKELQTPHLLTRDELALQVCRYVETFNLNIINSAQIQWTEYDEANKKWTITFQTPTGRCKAVSKHLVMATGIGSQKPYIPQIAEPHLFKGISLHSAGYMNATLLKQQGVKSVAIIGSANTAFDILTDCHNAGLKATMVARSPTYIVPLDYLCHEASLGAYDADLEAADNMFLSLPSVIDGQLARNLFAGFASAEPQRYAALKAAGFPALDSSDPSCALIHNLLERAGGHYVDVGGTKLIENKQVGMKACVEPTGYTASGLRFSDGSCLDVDTVIWCTGFADANAADTAAAILGGAVGVSGPGPGAAEANPDGGKDNPKEKVHILSPQEIASRLDATWGVDAEGEVRGMWKRHANIDNFWIMGGHTQFHRWHSRTLALQIKAALEGILPPAYRSTPSSASGPASRKTAHL
ncbi:monooxygenase [Aspergillus stella-maris]|uniref:monooxygenase n=1 Tax=Aspergillus stella-maris TaxID=1810926 RepID=UPI003CCCB16E